MTAHEAGEWLIVGMMAMCLIASCICFYKFVKS
jgi:hypothetical protein